MPKPTPSDVTFEDSRFGVFHLARLVKWFEAEAEWNSQPVRLALHVGNDLNADKALEFARLVWDSQADWDGKIYKFASDKLLQAKNDFWLQSGENKIEPAEFQSRMTLEHIGISSWGEIEFYFDDGELFWGHKIVVEGKVLTGLTDARFEG